MTRLLYDSTVPADIPGGAQMVAGYEHSWPLWLSPYADTTVVPRRARRIIWIDNNGSSPLASDVLDVESGAATIEGMTRWLDVRAAHGRHGAVYLSRSRLDAARKAAGTRHVRWWVADWSLTQAEAAALLGGGIVAVQYAAPGHGSPGHYDISVADDEWFAPAGPHVTAAELEHLAADVHVARVHADAAFEGVHQALARAARA